MASLTNPAGAQFHEYGFMVVYKRLVEGGYQVIVPAFPEIITFGPTIEDARDMAADAVRCHVEGLLKDGLPIPPDPFVEDQPVVEELKVRLQA
jgi:predicted RNase H-like HicB family nuclease